MTVETKWDLTEETLKKLQTLIRYNIDSCKGFKECADEIKNEELAGLFRDIASEREQQSKTLQSYVEYNCEEPEDDGSMRAALHRCWVNVRSTLSGGDTYAILAEAERGEDAIKEAYEDVLKENPGSAMSDVLHAQYAKVKEQHDRIRDLRDSYKDD